MNKRKPFAFAISLLTVAIALILISPRFSTPSSPLAKTLVGQFVYDIPSSDPITGLPVELWNQNGLEPILAGVTNATGHVVFEGLLDET